MDFLQAKDIILLSLFSITGFFIVLIGNAIHGQIKIAVESINELNIKMAGIVSHLESHKETLVRHEEHLQRLDGRFADS